MHYVPLGSLVPAEGDNVVAAGRCIDADNAALSSVRVMGPCIAMGAAAAKALDLAGTGSVHQIDIAALAARVRDNVETQAYEVAKPRGVRGQARHDGLAGSMPMKLTDHEKSMLDGEQGRAKARAMDLLVRYGEALGAERLVETNNVAGAFNASTPSVRELAKKGFDAVYSELNLDSPEIVEVPRMVANTCQLITGIDNEQLAHPGHIRGSCRPAEAGGGVFRPSRHQHVRDLHALPGRQCAGEGRALRLDGILRRGLLQFGARRAHQHRRQGEHRRRGAHRQDSLLGLSHRREIAAARISSKSRSRSTTSWIGACSATISARSSMTRFPVLTGALPSAESGKLKHFGAAAASSGGVELYHIPGVTPEAAFGRGGLRRQDQARPCSMARRNGGSPMSNLNCGTRSRRRFRHARLSA